MSVNQLFILLSFGIGIAATAYIRTFDTYEKEPLLKMVIVVLWGGVWSIVIADLSYGFLRAAGIGDLRNFLGAFLVIGPVEEGAKFLALLSAYFIIRKELNEPTDGLIYMFCVALGFSLIENYFYATQTADSGHLLFIRLLIATPMHIIFSSFMGIAFYMMMKHKTGFVLFFVSYFYASLVHGMWDAIVFHHLIVLFSLLLFLFTWRWTLSLLSYTAAKSPFKPSLKDFINNHGKIERSKGIECLGCGDKTDKYSFKGKGFVIQKCNRCQGYLANKNSLFRMFRFFGSGLKDLKKHYLKGKTHNRPYSTLYKGNYVSDDKQVAFFYLDELNDALNEFNQSIIEKIESRWWFPERLRLATAPKVAASNDEFVFHGADEFEFE